MWHEARTKVGRQDLHFHDLRHTSNTLAAATGASTKELMARYGHSSPRAALRNSTRLVTATPRLRRCSAV
jgi:integrase